MTKKRFLLALALMLTAVGGAWAQGHQRYATGSVDAATLQVGDTLCEGVTITGNGNNYLTLNIGRWKMSGNVMQASAMKMFPVTLGTGASIDDWGDIHTPATEGGEDGDAWLVTSNDEGYPFLSGILLPPPPAGTLVEDGNNQWHLTVPAGNVTLTVDYYGQYTLDSVPTAEGWQVKVNGTLATVTPYTPGSALGYVDNINETDSVELIPPAELRETIKAVRLTESVAAPAVVEPITVTINQSDWPDYVNSFTKDGVTVSADNIDPDDGNLMMGGSFSTTLGNFTSIVVTTFYCNASGTGWSGEYDQQTWSGTPASSVSFSGNFMGMGMGETTIVCTIQPNN